jgi:cupin 2 domain-containing protein
MNDLSRVRADWEKRGFSCDIWIDSPGQVWREFVHEVDELVMLIEGEIELSFGGKTFRPKIGQEIRIPKGESHTVANVGAAANRWYYGYYRK